MVPMIEFQFKTIETWIISQTGEAEHSTYKGQDKEEIQKQYDTKTYDVFDIPIMWISKNGEMKLLTPEEAFKKMHPFLKSREREDRNKLEGEEK